MCDVCRYNSGEKVACIVCKQEGLLKKIGSFYAHVLCASYSAMFMVISYK